MSEPSTTSESALPGAMERGSSGAQAYERMRSVALPDIAAVRAVAAAAEEEHPSRRRITSSLEPRSHVLPVPNGWYSIANSADLVPGDIVSIKLVDRDLVVYRGEDGGAHVLDAYCAHMGAHLGGGRVTGSCVQCPYHGWEYGADGRCARIPYSDARIPSRARVGSYPVDERHGLIHFWYHAGGASPSYEIPVVDEAADPAWTDAHVWEFELVAALQEMAENNIDYHHFRYVHGKQFAPVDTSEFHYDGPLSSVEESLGDGVSFTRHSFGPGVALLRFPELMTVVATTTPIDRGNCRLIWQFYFPADLEGAADDLIQTVVGPIGLQADVPIWRDMKYLERPVLVKGDGPIAEYRRWYAQFYEGNDSVD